MEGNVILLIMGEVNRILPLVLKSVGNKKVKVVRIYYNDYKFWIPERYQRRQYRGEKNPAMILIDNPSFESGFLVKHLENMLDALQTWHHYIPILQLKYLR